ncbi:putative leucine-rich repeat-containing, plant-type, leucine-rich repeat domain superfamily [Helianthus annuus]|nr:putative leucine-rich repeat-containing, plant-type, leucine-rich repeat domain superfamily [Helianthus annuus]
MMHKCVMSLVVCILFMSGGLGRSCIEKERQALLDVKANLNNFHGHLDDWGREEEKMDCCKWEGITCSNHNGHVIELDLSFKGIAGKISPSLQVLNQLKSLNLNYINFQSNHLPKFLGYLPKLESLDISGANLSGPIPYQLGNLSNLLHLDLSSNSLGGSIPFSFVDLTSLTYLNLSQNQLVGAIPKSFGNIVGQFENLIYLDIGHNSLNGRIPSFIGYNLGQLSNLEYLDFSSNSLEGVVTEVHFQKLTQLYYLDLSFNSLVLDLNFHERIPFQISIIKLQSCKLGPGFPVWIKPHEFLNHLDISNAGISDGVPDWFWDLPTALEFLNLSSNQIKGMLPNMGLTFSGSTGMDLSNNHFEGRVPSLPFGLAALNLSGNRFSGTLSFLCEIGQFLTFLDLSNNSLTGRLPDCWMKFQEKLVVLSLSDNNLSGEIPSSLGFLLNLEALSLRTNNFVGEVPMSLSNCTRLRFVDLGENKLSGVIPEWIGEKLSKLYALVLGSNRFYGRLPLQLCWLYNLQVLDLSNNGLSGNIPRCFNNFTSMARKVFKDDLGTHSYSTFGGRIPGRNPAPRACRSIINCRRLQFGETNEAQYSDNAWVAWKGTERLFGRSGLQLLKSIDLSRNNLSGKVPHEITSLYELVSLNLSMNKLHGEVLKDMGQLRYLESLDLSRNEFSGHIPWSLAQLNFLSYLDLSYNNLSGKIPTGSQLQRFSYTSYSGNPQLCGPPLTPRCGFAPVAGKKDVEEDEEDSWKSYYTGMGAGFAVGFSGICGALVLNHRCRYFFFALLSYIKDWIYVTTVVHFGKLERNLRR